MGYPNKVFRPPSSAISLDMKGLLEHSFAKEGKMPFLASLSAKHVLDLKWPNHIGEDPTPNVALDAFATVTALARTSWYQNDMWADNTTPARSRVSLSSVFGCELWSSQGNTP